MNKMRITILTFVLALLPTTAVANNNFFLLGDAFYSTTLTQSELAAIDASNPKSHVFGYANFGTWEGAFCGYAGYRLATVEGLDESFLENLKLVYGEIRRDYPRELVEIDRDGKMSTEETNPIRVFFYRNDFVYGEPLKLPEPEVPFGDPNKPISIPPKVHLGLKYNESWVAETVKFGHHRHLIRMCRMIDHPDAIMADWRDAESVTGLEIQLPDKIELDKSGIVTTPITITGEIKAIVIPPVSLEKYFQITNPEASSDSEDLRLPVYVVNSDGIQRLTLPTGE